MSRDLHSHLSILGSFSGSRPGSTDTNIDVDRRGYDSVEFLARIGQATFTDTVKVDVKVFESDDNSTFTAVDESNILSGSDDATGNTALTINETVPAGGRNVRCGYVGVKRYVRFQLENTGNSPASHTGVIVVGGNAAHEPTANQT